MLPVAQVARAVERAEELRLLDLVVELDGHAYHARAAAFERDRRRDADLAAAGYRVVRLTWRRVVGEPDRVAETLARVLRTRGGRRTRGRG